MLPSPPARNETPPISLSLPRPVPPSRVRTPKKNIPQTPLERQRILHLVRAYVAEFTRCRPFQPSNSRARRAVPRDASDRAVYRDYIGVLLNNEMWREQLAGVPFERRLLLLPKCLRVESKCPAPFDEFGLLCKQCGLCSIQDLQAEAERLGYAVLVAEGSAIVMSLIQTGKIEAIVGVSCLSVLERAFPYMEAAAIPGVAVPLLQDDCIDTTVDLDWVWDYIHLTSDDKTRRLDLGALARRSRFLVHPAQPRRDHGRRPRARRSKSPANGSCRAGKRWRPFLDRRRFPGAAGPPGRAAARRSPQSRRRRRMLPQSLADPRRHRGQRRAALRRKDPARRTRRRRRAERRRPAHRRRLPSARRHARRQRRTESRDARGSPREGQRELCRGQGAELCWARTPAPLSSLEVLDIFRKKTAPAFEVALRLGALYAGVDSTTKSTMCSQAYSEALGIAYQIRDDLSDLGAGGETNDIAGLRPSLLLATALTSAPRTREQGADSNAHWRRRTGASSSADRSKRIYRELERRRTLPRLCSKPTKRRPSAALRDLENANLKGLLRRVLGKIFNDTEIKGWCKEFEKRTGVVLPSVPANEKQRYVNQ